jgi:hypothetical protein
MHFTRLQLLSSAFCWGAVAILLTGCFGGNSATRGVPLSEAMSASASGSKANLARNDSYPEPSHSHNAELSFAMAATGAEESSSDSFDDFDSDDSFVMAFSLEQVFPIANDIRSISRLELIPLSFQNEETYAGLYVGWGDVEFQSGSFPDQAISGTRMADIGLIGRHYFTPPKTFVSPYLTGGVYGQILMWDYRSPLNYNGEIIQSDSILGGGGFVGLGLSVARKEFLGVFCEARLGVHLYDDATMQGFYNDMMDAYAYVSLRGGVCIKF